MVYDDDDDDDALSLPKCMSCRPAYVSRRWQS